MQLAWFSLSVVRLCASKRYVKNQEKINGQVDKQATECNTMEHYLSLITEEIQIHAMTRALKILTLVKQASYKRASMGTPGWLNH